MGVEKGARESGGARKNLMKMSSREITNAGLSDMMMD